VYYFKYSRSLNCVCAHMLTVLCRETGLDCDYVIKGKTEEEILKNGAEHAMKVHGMKVDDIYLDKIPTNLLCQIIGKLADK
jgi:predicted small metal-binding protein